MEYSTPKGMRDFLPDEMAERELVLDRIRAVFRKYGFVPLETPAMENLETLEKKCGDEISGQLFRIDGGLALRFDLTVPLARVAANNTFPKPFKRYCISRVWRREEPQKGRFREFWQADIDIIGAPTMRAEAELLACASECIVALGFPKPSMRVNNRKILDGMVRALGIPVESEFAVFRCLDKLQKIGDGRVAEELAAKGIASDKIEKLIEFTKTDGSEKEKLALAEKYSEEGAGELRLLLALCKEYGTGAEIDFSLVRGLDYYTGPIFEISLSKEIGSVAGGGRYDNLLSLYGQADCATGISLGIERLMALRKKKEASSGPRVFVACVKEEFYPDALAVASELRSRGVPCSTDLNGRNLRKQIEYAAAAGASYLVVVGEKERKEKRAKVRDLASGEEKEMAFGAIADFALTKD